VSDASPSGEWGTPEEDAKDEALYRRLLESDDAKACEWCDNKRVVWKDDKKVSCPACVHHVRAA